jgi:hypothetical protein
VAEVYIGTSIVQVRQTKPEIFTKTKFYNFFVALVLFAGASWAVAQVTFAPDVTYGVGNNPESFTVADVNGDGKMDLICGNAGASPYNNGTLSILTNNGIGGFVLASTLSIGHGPGSITAADVNGDGKVDLITANWDNGNGSTLSVWTNNGNGVFVSNVTLNVGSGPGSIIAVDANGDGRLDLICANYGTSGNGNTLTMLTNNGSGVFGSNATLNVGNAPSSVIAADVNGDGKLDLICANYGANTLSVLTNNGSGVFGSNATLNVGSGPNSVIAADINGNGKVDLICANFGNGLGNTLSVLTNNGSGVFGSNATLNVGSGPSSVIAADVNGDGKLDLICANGTFPGTLSVLTNNSRGGFVLASTPGVGNLPQSVVAVDVNGDGKLDLTCVNRGANTVSVLINTTIFSPSTSTPTLTIKPSGSSVQVSWPSASAGWSLQQNLDLTTAHWGPSGYSGYGISDDGTNKSLSMPPLPGNLFFRLLHP